MDNRSYTSVAVLAAVARVPVIRGTAHCGQHNRARYRRHIFVGRPSVHYQLVIYAVKPVNKRTEHPTSTVSEINTSECLFDRRWILCVVSRKRLCRGWIMKIDSDFLPEKQCVVIDIGTKYTKWAESIWYFLWLCAVTTFTRPWQYYIKAIGRNGVMGGGELSPLKMH